MITLVLGGSGSGKSEFAESLLLKTESKNKYYIATMKVYGEEGQKKVDRHRKLREGKGFFTIESPTDIYNACSKGCKGNNCSAIVECMSNLIANEMFTENEAESRIIQKEVVVEKVINDIIKASYLFEDLIIVSNNIFDDGIEYDEQTRGYICVLGEINQKIAKLADRVYEVVVGIPVKQKGEI